jgi:cytochrome c553
MKPDCRISLALGLVSVVLLCTSQAASAADAAAGKAKAKTCQTCHGIDGIAKQPTVPHLAGESEMYLTKQLKAFRDGERKDPQMSIMAKPLTDEDIANLAAWYSSIKITVTLPQ